MSTTINQAKIFAYANTPAFKSSHKSDNPIKADKSKEVTKSELSCMSAEGIYIATKNKSKDIKADVSHKDGVKTVTIKDSNGKKLLSCPTFDEHIDRFKNKTIDIDDFHKIGEFKDKKVKLNNGKDFTGFIEDRKFPPYFSDDLDDVTNVYEYKDGKLVESTKWTAGDAIVKKYDDGELKSVVEYESTDDAMASRVSGFELYSKDKAGNRICTDYNYNDDTDSYDVSSVKTAKKDNDGAVVVDEVGENLFGEQYSVHHVFKKQ